MKGSLRFVFRLPEEREGETRMPYAVFYCMAHYPLSELFICSMSFKLPHFKFAISLPQFDSYFIYVDSAQARQLTRHCP